MVVDNLDHHDLNRLGSPEFNFIQDDNEFKVKFYTYLLEQHGDVGFYLPEAV